MLNLILFFGGVIFDCGFLLIEEFELDKGILVYLNLNNGNFMLEIGIENGYM